MPLINKPIYTSILIVATSLLLACGGGGGGSGGTDVEVSATNLPTNTLPTVTTISNQTIDEDTSTGPVAFINNDVETPADSLVITATSNDQALIPNASLLLSGSGTNRTSP